MEEEKDEEETDTKEDVKGDSGDKLASYLEESKDTDVLRLSYDDDEDGETICEIEDAPSN